MNRKELVGAVAAHAGMEPREVDKALKGMTEVIEAVAAKGEQVTISGFAKFARVDRPARMARNPATGAPVKVKASRKAKGVWPPAAKAPAKVAPTRKAAAAPASKAATSKAPAAMSPDKPPATKVARAPKRAAAAKTAVKKR
jgi:DNA-binding protein HU-beta